MSTQDAANGFVSGELLLRSDENDDRCLPPALEKRLRDSLRGRVARKRCGRSLRRAAILREAAAERRGATVASIAAAKTRGEGLVEEGRAAARRARRARADAPGAAGRGGRGRAPRDARDPLRQRRGRRAPRGAVPRARRRGRAAQGDRRAGAAEPAGGLRAALRPRDARRGAVTEADAARRAVRAMSTGRGGERAARLLRERRALRGAGRRRRLQDREPVPAGRVPARGGEEEDAAERREEKAVKGLFCDVPAASVERLVLYGLRGDAAPLERTLFDDAWLADQSRTPGAPTAASPGGFGGTVERKPTEVKARRARARRGFPRVSARLLAVLDARERARRRAERW